ncbi:hypothetical protein AVEN_166450-1 [Araneus ventricosus]|uniref:Uncharacterized protein n=1 Tax=Araneus ventricosus TaxID=182803 RepID=A0A4Y2F0H5_ARAVE|nr:hypothetical protein AVEN_166450-1 [Araneus ventricosus]
MPRQVVALLRAKRGPTWYSMTFGTSVYIQRAAKRGYFGTDFVILNRWQMTRTTPELAPPLQTSAPHQQEDVWLHTYDVQQVHYTTDLYWNRVSNMEPPAPKPTL